MRTYLDNESAEALLRGVFGGLNNGLLDIAGAESYPTNALLRSSHVLCGSIKTNLFPSTVGKQRLRDFIERGHSERICGVSDNESVV